MATRPRLRRTVAIAGPGEWFVVSNDANHMILHKHTYLPACRMVVFSGDTMTFSQKRRIRRHRRQARAGKNGRPRHRLAAGRTGSVHHKKRKSWR